MYVISPFLLGAVALGVFALGGIWLFAVSGEPEGTWLARLIPPEIWVGLDPAIRASVRVVARAERERQERFAKALRKLAEGYVREGKTITGRQAYEAALLELLGRYAL